eukprot:11806891-Prorocentrum_lima.AAC.1
MLFLSFALGPRGNGTRAHEGWCVRDRMWGVLGWLRTSWRGSVSGVEPLWLVGGSTMQGANLQSPAGKRPR